MHILTVEAVGQFVGLGFSDHRRAGGEQALDGGSGARRRRMRLEPDRIAIAGAMAGNVVDILDREGQAVKRTCGRAIQRNVGVAAEGAIRIVWDHCGRCSVAGARDTVLRPRL
jgi:hypothetical protein